MFRALSVRQPWAYCIVSGFNRAENRTWTTRYRGPLLIHASASTADFNEESELFTYEAGGQPFIDACNSPGCEDVFMPDHFSSIIGMAELYDVLPVEDVPPELASWATGPLCFMVRDAMEFETPIPCRGALSIWKLPEELEAAVEKEIELAKARAKRPK